MNEDTTLKLFATFIFSAIILFVVAITYGIAEMDRLDQLRRWDVEVQTANSTNVVVYTNVCKFEYYGKSACFVDCNGFRIDTVPVWIKYKEVSP